MTYDRTLIVIRERSFLELLDLALVVVRDRPVVLGVTALAGIAPFATLNIWLLSDIEFPRVLWLVLLLMDGKSKCVKRQRCCAGQECTQY